MTYLVVRLVVTSVAMALSSALWAQAPATDTARKVYTFAEVPPRFPGGEQGLRTYLAKNIHYPKKAVRKEKEGTVYVKFVVEPDGSVTSAQVIRGMGYGCDQEVLRVIRAMPNWTPGTQDGKPVPVYFTLPVIFQLSG
jgi:protein TonB